MIVTRENLEFVIQRIKPHKERGLDSETTGLSEDDRLFSLIISIPGDDILESSFYFNFQQYEDFTPESLAEDPENIPPEMYEFLEEEAARLNAEQEPLPKEVLARLQAELFSDPEAHWDITNAKFDMRMLANEGCELVGTVMCNSAAERVIKNNIMDGKDPYSLAAMARRRGWEKDEAVKEYIEKHKLTTKVQVPGKKKTVSNPHFERVPFAIVSKYGEKDGHLHLSIGKDQRRAIADLEAKRPDGHPSYYPVFENEKRLVKTCFRMERRGIKVDRPFVATALEYELNTVKDLQKQFLELTGEPYADSRGTLTKVFDAAGEKYPTTDKGNPSFAAEVLEGMTSPIAAIVNKVRYHEKRAGTYYSSFLHYADRDGILHADCRQMGTETGRFSYRDPNLQNVPKEDEPEDETTPFHVRQSFIPRPGHFFYSVDYQQQEFRVFLDYAGETELIKEINAGADVHQATADLCGITRKQAKTINFGLLYGMGVVKLAGALGITLKEAKALRALYFGKLPKVESLVKAIINAGENRGYIFNCFGRRNHIASRNWAYILPNHLIQGSCADIIKFAMNEIDQYLIDNKLQSKMLLQVHDELLIETPIGEEEIIIPIVDIMQRTYKPQNGMLLTTSIEHSFKSWGNRDKVKGIPNASKST